LFISIPIPAGAGALHFYQLAISAPMPPKGFFNKEAAKAALPLNRSFSGFLAHDPLSDAL